MCALCTCSYVRTLCARVVLFCAEPQVRSIANHVRPDRQSTACTHAHTHGLRERAAHADSSICFTCYPMHTTHYIWQSSTHRAALGLYACCTAFSILTPPSSFLLVHSTSSSPLLRSHSFLFPLPYSFSPILIPPFPSLPLPPSHLFHLLSLPSPFLPPPLLPPLPFPSSPSPSLPSPLPSIALQCHL